MGIRGPKPSSGVVFVGRDGIAHDVVIRAHGAPYLHLPGHPLATASGHVPVLRLAASEALGRWVTRGEAVLPIDGDPWNWEPRNLQVKPLAQSLPPARRGARRPKAVRPKAARVRSAISPKK